MADVQAQLRELSRDPSLRRRENSLAALADALDGPDGYLWAKVNLFDAFGEESLVVEGERSLVNRVSALEIVRNFAILLPLLWTWAAIGFAITAFNGLLESVDPNEASLVGAPFIEQWAKGFGGRTSISFSVVAYVDALLILVVVALSIYVGFQQKRLDVRIEEERSEKWNELREALTQASVVLAEKAYDTPQRFNEELTRLWGSYQGVSDQLRHASDALQDAVGESRNHTSGLSEASAALQHSGAAISSGADVLNETLIGVRTDVAALAVSIGDVAGEVRELISTHQKLSGRLEDGMAQTSQATAALEATAVAIPVQVGAAGDQLMAAVREELKNRSAVSDDLARAGEHAMALANNMDKSSRQFLDAAATLQDVAGGLPLELSKATTQISSSVEQAEQSLSQLPGRIAEGLNGLKDLPPQLASLDGRYRETNEALTGASIQLNAYAEGLSRASDQLESTIGQLRAQGDQVPEQVEALTRSVADVAAACSDVAHSVASAAGVSTGASEQRGWFRRSGKRAG